MANFPCWASVCGPGLWMSQAVFYLHWVDNPYEQYVRWCISEKDTEIVYLSHNTLDDSKDSDP